MGDIKIDEIDYIYFLNNVANYLNEVKSIEPKNLAGKSKEIESYIKNQLQLRKVMTERKLYYEFYLRNKKENKAAAYEAYQNYKKCSYEIRELRKN